MYGIRQYFTTRAVALLLLTPTPELLAADDAKDEFEQTFGDVDTVSIATGYSQPLHTAPSVASVFTAEDIRNSGARDLIDMLNQVPGFHIGHTANLWDPVLAVRGFSSVFNQNVLFLLDGVPQTERVFGDRRTVLGTVPLDLIERVEVIRGPGSALYGADAYAAVVNVSTRHTATAPPQLTVSGGSQDTAGVRGLASRRFDTVDVVGAFEYRETDQHQPWIERDQQTRLDTLFGTHASLAPGRANTHRAEWGAQLNASSAHTTLGVRASGWRDVGLGTGTAGALDPFGHVDATTVEATLRHRRNLATHWNLTSTLDGALFRYSLNDLHFFPPGAFGVFPDGVVLDTEFEERFLRLHSVLDYTGLPQHTLRLGFGGERATAKLRSEHRNYFLSDGNILPSTPGQETSGSLGLSADPIVQDLVFAYLQDEWLLHPDWTLTWGVRYDHYSNFGATVNPRAALVWSARHDLSVKLLYGRGFRTPTLLETHAEQIPVIHANPNLHPEKVDNLELAFDYRPRLDVQTRLSLWAHRTVAQIRQQNSGDPIFHPENVGQQHGHGLELELTWDVTPRTRFSGYYAYQTNTDKTTGNDAGYSPHHKLFGRLQHRYGRGLFSLQATHIGARDRIAEDTRPTADRYTLVDLLARYEISPHLEVGLDVRNLFAAHAKDAGFGTAFPGDIPLSGRTYYCSIRGRF